MKIMHLQNDSGANSCFQSKKIINKFLAKNKREEGA